MNPARHRSANNSGRMTNVSVISRHCSTLPLFIAVRVEAAVQMKKLCHPLQPCPTWCKAALEQGLPKCRRWGGSPVRQRSSQWPSAQVTLRYRMAKGASWGLGRLGVVLMHTRAGRCRSSLKPRVGRSHGSNDMKCHFPVPICMVASCSHG